MKILAAIRKEWIVLWRDKVGLVILFVLPMCLVFFISLTSTAQSGNKPLQKLDVLVLNQDTTSNAFVKALKQVDLLHVVQAPRTASPKSVKNAVIQGHYSIAIVIPRHATQQMVTYIQQNLKGQTTKIPQPIQLFLDPGLPTPLQSTLVSTLDLMASHIQNVVLVQTMSQLTQGASRGMSSDFLKVKTSYVALTDEAKAPNTVEYNVPAWTLFGMFFIVIPLAGVMVRERELGMNHRIDIAPTTRVELMLGRMAAFMLLNQVQLWLMLAVGVYLLPLFGLPVLQVSQHIPLIFITGIFASLAATGFGLLIGTWATTYEQATVLGPFIIVIAAAIGGIFAPTNLMPSFLQTISGLSPLNWAQNAFIDIFVRHATFHQLIPAWLKLFGFFILMLFLSWARFLHPKNWYRKMRAS